jgi:hypothetical protein
MLMAGLCEYSQGSGESHAFRTAPFKNQIEQSHLFASLFPGCGIAFAEQFLPGAFSFNVRGTAKSLHRIMLQWN